MYNSVPILITLPEELDSLWAWHYIVISIVICLCKQDFANKYLNLNLKLNLNKWNKHYHYTF